MGRGKKFSEELKKATLDYRNLFKVFGKDILIFFIIMTMFLGYFYILFSAYPQQPWWATDDKIMQASPLELQLKTNEITAFILMFTLLSIAGVLALLVLFSSFKEWVWSSLSGEKYSFRHLPAFIGLNTLMYVILAAIILVIAFFAGLIVKALGMAFTPAAIIMIVAMLFFIPIVFLVLHFINYSGYSFVKTRKFGRTFLDTFRSFAMIKKLILPYAVILIVFAVIGTIFDILFSMQNFVLSIIAYVLLFAFLAWEKVYSSHFFKRIYG